jgi:hypothetical protein
MKGKAQAEQIKAFRMKKQADAAQFSYNNDADKYLSLVKQYGDPQQLMKEKQKIESEMQAGGAPTGQAGVVGAVPRSTPESSQKSARLDELNKQLQEFGQAKGAVDKSWNDYLQIYGNLIDPSSGKGKKGKGKQSGGKDAQGNPLQMAFSKDPNEKMQGIYGTLQRMGPPVYIQAQDAASKRAQSDRQYTEQKSGNEAQAEQLKSQLATLEQQDISGMSEAERAQHTTQIQQKKDAINALAGTSTTGQTTKFGIPRPIGGDVTGADLKKMYPMGVPGPSGTFVPNDADAYRGAILGIQDGQEVVAYNPSTVHKQTKSTADAATGQPILQVFNPLTGKLGDEAIAHLPQKAQFIKVTRSDANGNPKEDVVALLPQYKHFYVKPPAGSTYSRPVDVGSEGDIKRGAQIVDQTGQPIDETKPSKPTPEQHRAKTADDHSKQADKVAKESGVPHGTILEVDKYSKPNQDAAKAIAGQELTINGMPGSKTDIGLKKSTLKVLENKEDLENIAVAMRALDSLAKTQSAGHDSGDYGWVSYFKDSWSAIPAVNDALSKVSPTGQTYLTNFFRAWTNAATIRSLQGSSGKPQQAMYAMLSNELPVLGVNVQDEAQAIQKINSLQDDVDVAKGFLPKALQDSLNEKFPRTPDSTEHKHAASSSSSESEKKESDKDIQERLNRKYGAGAGQPAGSTQP